MPRHKALEWEPMSGSVAVAVCSHDCDIENPRERTGIIIAPLVKVPARPGEPRYDLIMASGDTRTDIHYGQLFPVSYRSEDRDLDAVVDFSAMTSYAKAEKVIPKLLEARVLSCDDATRADIARKLAMFLGRPYQTKR